MTNYHNYLHQQALKVAAQYRKSESELLDLLQKIDNEKVFRRLGYKSLFDYATHALKLSEGQAYSFIQVARKAKEVPELKVAISQGELSISKAQRVVSVITPENQENLLKLAKELPKRELEKQVAKLNPQALVVEKSRYVTEERLELRLGVSEKLMLQLKRVQDLVSTKQMKAATLEDTLNAMTEEYLDRHDLLVKAKRLKEKDDHTCNVELCPGTFDNASATIPNHIKREVILRDHAQCSYVDKAGNQCQEQRWLNFHHVMPRAHRGKHTTDNLKLLCAGHHKVVHM